MTKYFFFEKNGFYMHLKKTKTIQAKHLEHSTKKT